MPAELSRPEERLAQQAEELEELRNCQLVLEQRRAA
jgi:hypothetical protein